MSDLPLCKCGCGTQVEKKTKKYYGDHFRNPPIGVNPKTIPSVEKTVSAPSPKKINAPSEKSVKKGPISKQLELATKQLKRKTKPIPGGKISKKNLLSSGLGIYTC